MAMLSFFTVQEYQYTVHNAEGTSPETGTVAGAVAERIKAVPFEAMTLIATWRFRV